MPAKLFAISLLVLAAAVPLKGQAAARFSNPPGIGSPRGYSQVVEVPAASRLIFLSGQVPLDSAGNLVGAGNFKAQATQVFENLRRALAATGGASFKDVVKLNFYLTDIRNLAALREVRDRFVDTSTPPASTLVEVKGLFRNDVMLEVEAVAAPVAP